MGFTPIDDSEIASNHTGFTPISEDDIALGDSQPAPTDNGYLMGGLKGIAKGALDVVTAPADLLYRGGNAAADYIAGTQTDPENLKAFYPSNLLGGGIDELSGNTGNTTAEAATHIASNLGTAFAIPSQASNIASKIPLLPSLLAKVIGYGTEGAAYGVLGDPKADNLLGNAETGAAINTAIPGAGSVIGNLLDKIGITRGSTKLANSLADELRSVVPDALTSDITAADRATSVIQGLEEKGNAARDAAGNLFKGLPSDPVNLDNAIQNISDYAEKIGGPVSPNGTTSNLINALKRLQIPEQVVETPASTILDASGNPAVAANTKIIPGTPAIQPLNEIQNTLRDIGKLQRGATGVDSAVLGMAKGEVLKAAEAQVSPDALDALKTARKAWADMSNTFEEGAVGSVRDALSEPTGRLNTFKTKLLNDPKSAEQLTSIMNPEELGHTQNLILGDLLAKQPVTWEREISKRYDSYKAIFGQEKTDQLLNMMTREGTIGKKLLQDNNGLRNVLHKAAFPAIASGVGYELEGRKGALGGLLFATLGGKAGKIVNSAKSVIMRAAIGNPEALALLNAPASKINYSEALGKIGALLKPELSKDNPPPLRQALSTVLNKQGTKMDNVETPKILAADRVPATSKDEAIAKIKSNPTALAIAMTESNLKSDLSNIEAASKAKNPDSTAEGLYQFVDKTARSLGLKDKTNIPASLNAFEAMTEQNQKIIGSNDPDATYLAHVLGAPLAKKVLNQAPLTSDEQQKVNYFFVPNKDGKSPYLNFKKNYALALEQTGQA